MQIIIPLQPEINNIFAVIDVLSLTLSVYYMMVFYRFMPEEFKNRRYRVKLLVFNVLFMSVSWRNLMMRFNVSFALSMFTNGEMLYDQDEVLLTLQVLFTTGACFFATVLSWFCFNCKEFYQQGIEPMTDGEEKTANRYEELDRSLEITTIVSP